MKKFKFNNQVFEMNYNNDIAPVVLDKEREESDAILKELQKKFPNNKIFSYSTNTYNEESGELTPITYYYTGAECVNVKKYKSIERYDYDFPPEDILMEVILQADRFKRKFYIPIKNVNCTMMDLIDTAVDKIRDILFKYEKEEEDWTLLFLYDDGGWQIDIEMEKDKIESFITSVRLVEEVNE